MEFVCSGSDRVAPQTPPLRQPFAVLGILRKGRLDPSEQDKGEGKV